MSETFIFRGRTFRSASGAANVLVQTTSGEGAEEKLPPDSPSEDAESHFEAGYSAGFTEGQTQLQGTIDQLRQDLGRVSEELPRSLASVLSALEEQARREVGLVAFRIAETILRSRAARSSVVLSAIDEAVGSLGDTGDVELRLHPADAQLIAGTEDGVSAHMTVVPDPGLTPGDVVVVTREGLLDGKLQSRLGIVQQIVEDACGLSVDHDPSAPET